MSERKDLNRRELLRSSGALALAGGALLSGRAAAQHRHSESPEPAPPPPPPAAAAPPRRRLPYTPVVNPNGATLPFEWKDGVKEFRLVAEELEAEFAPGMKVKCWGYNGSTPGPTIEAVEGDRVRILVTNHLPEHTTIHWHGILLPSGMDGVGGLSQPHIQPGETWVYEFTLRQQGTHMYHPHADEMVQLAAGMMGLFVIHPRRYREPPPDRDFAMMLHEWAIHPGTFRPDPSVMLDFNLFTINGKAFPAIEPMVARTGDRVRMRFGNLSMDQHPMHLHGFSFEVVGTDGGPVPPSARWPAATVAVPVGSTRDIEFVAEYPGDWAFHCHKSHHTMNAMGHDVPNLLGVDQSGVEDKIRELLPDYMAMGREGMADMQPMSRHMRGPENTLPRMMGVGLHGPIEMGGMFTVLKVRDDLASYDQDPGWYDDPPGTRATKLGEQSTPGEG